MLHARDFGLAWHPRPMVPRAPRAKTTVSGVATTVSREYVTGDYMSSVYVYPQVLLQRCLASLLCDSFHRTNPGPTLTHLRQRTGDLAVGKVAAPTVMLSWKRGYGRNCFSSYCQSLSPSGCTENTLSDMTVPSFTPLQRRPGSQR